MQQLNIRQLVEDAFLEGWRVSLEAYSVWTNGEQLTAMGRRMRDEQAKAPQNAKIYFDSWLDRQKNKFEEKQSGLS